MIAIGSIDVRLLFSACGIKVLKKTSVTKYINQKTSVKIHNFLYIVQININESIASGSWSRVKSDRSLYSISPGKISIATAITAKRRIEKFRILINRLFVLILNNRFEFAVCLNSLKTTR